MSQSLPRRAQRGGKGGGLAAKVSESAGQGATAPERRDLYDEVTAKIIHELEGGRFPWVQPWAKAGETGSGAISAASKAADYLLALQNEAKSDALVKSATSQTGGQGADKRLRSAA